MAQTHEEVTARGIIGACGGIDNLVKVDGAISRIEVWVHDTTVLDTVRLRAMTLSLVVQKNKVQLIVGAQAQVLLQELALIVNTEPDD
ncbi:phosphotransferase system IIB component [Arcanobacterium pluranimalium]|uniref:hypothetical protein n=1 Tax=Arcanobacterium pluranimalium TaxID=108028 RepID=UPI00195F136A|nr:hypothetical protein [Arcanobacterium pluranimalium]MBM7825719.1 phosphotransferase system IIB component [Arcanobacterium pluranimalium]